MPTPTAHVLLAALQDAVARKDERALGRLFDDEVVLFGTTAENLDRAQTEAYLARVLTQPGTLRWEWHQVVRLWESREVLAFAAVGTVGFDDEQGRPDGPRDDFRLTCVAVSTWDGWRLRHFHGSVPEPA
jgi:hypothetical protein